MLSSLSKIESVWLKGNGKFLLGSSQPSIADLSLVCEIMQLEVLGLKLKQLESEIETKTKEAKAVETNAKALRKQYVGFLLEYDRLLQENQNLRNQLQSLDRRLSHSGSKKNT